MLSVEDEWDDRRGALAKLVGLLLGNETKSLSV